MVIALSLFLHFGCADPAYLYGVEGQLSSMTVLRATLKNRDFSLISTVVLT